MAQRTAGTMAATAHTSSGARTVTEAVIGAGIGITITTIITTTTTMASATTAAASAVVGVSTGAGASTAAGAGRSTGAAAWVVRAR